MSAPSENVWAWRFVWPYLSTTGYYLPFSKCDRIQAWADITHECICKTNCWTGSSAKETMCFQASLPIIVLRLPVIHCIFHFVSMLLSGNFNNPPLSSALSSWNNAHVSSEQNHPESFWGISFWFRMKLLLVTIFSQKITQEVIFTVG